MSITQSPVVELRQYVLKPGAADALVEVFEAELPSPPSNATPPGSAP
jgi:hypothetical protein